LYFPNLKEECEEHKLKILQFYETLKEKLPNNLSNGVLDFMILKDRVLLLEVNQWAKSTGSGLFDWDKDDKILTNDSNITEIRIATEEKKSGFRFFAIIMEKFASKLTK